MNCRRSSPAAHRTGGSPLLPAEPDLAASVTGMAGGAARFGPYVRLARPHHWFKNLLILPGALLFWFFHPAAWDPTRLAWLAGGLVCACVVSASNYVLNEILDSPGDALHPEKAFRPVPSGLVRLPVAYAEWLLLAAAGLSIGFAINPRLGAALAMLWIMGALYNVPPARLKDRPYVDVLSEAINNPVRLVIGWYAVGQGALPAWWVLLAYWMLGAFMMAVKRFAEYRWIADPDRAARYRRSFGHYDEPRLLAGILVYALLFAGISLAFALIHRPELLLALPLVLVAMWQYVRLGFRDDSPMRDPDHLYQESGLTVLWVASFLACAVLLFFDVPGFTALFGASR